MAKKGSMPNFETIDEYIENQSIEAQTKLKEIRSIIHDVVPGVREILNYKVPSFVLVDGGKRDQQIMMAAYEKFIGFYPFPTTMAAFSEELKEFKRGKGSVQFPLSQPLPLEVIKKMVAYRKNELMNDLNQSQV